MRNECGGVLFSKKAGLAWLFCAVFWSAASAYGGDSQDLKTLRLQALAASRVGSFARAEELLRAGLAALAQPESSAAVVLWNELGSVQHSQWRLADAEQDLRRALAINARLPEPDDDQSAIALNNLGTIAGERHETTKAEKLLREAYRSLEKRRQDEGQTAALVRGNLALTLQQEGRYAEAGTLYDLAVTGVQQWYGRNSLECARLLTNQTLFRIETGQCAAAVKSGKETVEIERNLPFVSQTDRALAMNNLGFALSGSGQFEEAQPALREAIRLEESLPNGKEQLISSLNNLASLEEKQGKLECARADASRALELMNQEDPPGNDVMRVAVWNTLGRLATDEHQFQEAREFLTRAYELGKTGAEPAKLRYAATLSNLGALESAQKHYKRAESLYREALEIDESRLGSKNPEVASDLSNLATQLFYERRRKDALELYGRARLVMEKSFGPESLEVARNWRNVGIAYYADKQFKESAAAYESALEGLSRSAGPRNEKLPGWLREYALALRKDHQFGAAEAAETRALGIEVRNTLAAQKADESAAASKSLNGKT